ncbi:MAG: hypothetical protein AB1431_07260 [Pseudomonadota bacterium]
MIELTRNERIVYEALVRAADASEPCPSNDILLSLIDSEHDSEPPRLLGRLVAKGAIEREIFQRSRRVCIVATGKCTAMPMSTAPHWRDRPKEVPAPSIAAVRERAPDIAAQILTQAAKMGKPAVEYLADLVFVGWKVEQERG